MDQGLDVLVLGSANRDLTLPVARLPGAGETVLAGQRALGCGGKGANQAVAASAAGARTAFAGCVGADADGAALRAALAAAGVDTSMLRTDSDRPTGLAVIMVAENGENVIAVTPGANHSLAPDDVERLGRALSSAAVLLTQLEIPPAVVAAAVRAADAAGTAVVLNYSPVVALPPEVLPLVSVLVVNAGEAAHLLERPGLDDLRAAADALRALGPRAVVVTAGGAGGVYATADEVAHVPAPPVEVIDTTGAGDAFAGALAAELARTRTLSRAVEQAVRAGAAAVQHRGAQLLTQRRDGPGQCE